MNFPAAPQLLTVTTAPTEASWWMLAPWLALGVAVTIIGLFGSRRRR